MYFENICTVLKIQKYFSVKLSFMHFVMIIIIIIQSEIMPRQQTQSTAMNFFFKNISFTIPRKLSVCICSAIYFYWLQSQYKKQLEFIYILLYLSLIRSNTFFCALGYVEIYWSRRKGKIFSF